ncbi:uncharacterized protein B0H18DRAFT_1017765 [Fomitopsis serialis]|uniref:uncharacterized protein n=1 Tax=Fomitopsis serialis TaxID=139415 RepID=UPI0020076DFE|nr:uncharacterized protein B0H18DRAFT_1017765 [Neoantrodia serialis]KAH9922483.1 hypothetical protein B0H18DRAFT_1017765 [Neoantrodia serialis]
MDPVTIPHDCLPAIARVRISAGRYDYFDVLAVVAEDISHTALWAVDNIEGHPLSIINDVLLQLNVCSLNDLTLTNVDALICTSSQLSSHILSGWSHLNRLAFVGCGYISAWLSLLRAGAFPALDLLVVSHSDYNLDTLADALSTRVATHLRRPLTLQLTRAGRFSPLPAGRAWSQVLTSVSEVLWESCSCTMSTRCWLPSSESDDDPSDEGDVFRHNRDDEDNGSCSCCSEGHEGGSSCSEGNSGGDEDNSNTDDNTSTDDSDSGDSESSADEDPAVMPPAWQDSWRLQRGGSRY